MKCTILHLQESPNLILKFTRSKVKAHTSQRPTRAELTPVSLAWSTWKYYYSPLDGMLVHRRVTPSIISLVPIYTPGWRETVWSKVSCLRKQRCQHQGSNSEPPARTSDTLTITLICLHQIYKVYQIPNTLLTIKNLWKYISSAILASLNVIDLEAMLL